MKTGLVKWFNDGKAMVLSSQWTGDLTSMFTSTRSDAPDGWS